MTQKTTTALIVIHGCSCAHHRGVDAALREALAPKALVISFTHPAPGVEQPAWVQVEDSFYPDKAGEHAAALTSTIKRALGSCISTAVEESIQNTHTTAAHQQVAATLKQQRRLGALG